MGVGTSCRIPAIWGQTKRRAATESTQVPQAPRPRHLPTWVIRVVRAVLRCAALPITGAPGRGHEDTRADLSARHTRSCPLPSAADWSVGEPLPLPRVTQEDDGDMDEAGRVCETPWRRLPQ